MPLVSSPREPPRGNLTSSTDGVPSLGSEGAKSDGPDGRADHAGAKADQVASRQVRAKGSHPPQPEERAAPKGHAPHRRRRYVVVALVLLLLVAGGFAAWSYLTLQSAAPQAQRAAPETVAATHAQVDIWRTRLPAVGTLQAVQGVDVTAEVAGLVRSIAFESGQEVKQGELLVQFEDTVDRARIAALEAQVQQAHTEVRRDEYLVERGAGRAVQLERDRAEVETLTAQAGEQVALAARKAIRAPFDGILDIRQINLGQYLNPGQAIVTLQTFAPIYVNFSLPERYLARLAPGLPIKIQVDAFVDRTFEGSVTTINPLVTTATRNVRAHPERN